MNDSNAPDHLAEKHERDREQRVEAIERWVEYIQSEPPEVWGPQQNAIVDDQLDAAESIETSAAAKRHVRDLATDILESADE